MRLTDEPYRSMLRETIIGLLPHEASTWLMDLCELHTCEQCNVIVDDTYRDRDHWYCRPCAHQVYLSPDPADPRTVGGEIDQGCRDDW